MNLQKRVLLVNLFAPSLTQEEARDDATEMYNLIASLGDVIVVDMIHQRGYPAKDAYIGVGKADEVSQKILEQNIDIVVLNGYAKSRQLYTLWNILSEVKRTIEVWDRVDLVLSIFAKHAHTAEAKLQIELARMRHMGPRIYGMGHVLSQQAGGIGTRGIGETNVELMKRHWKDAMRLKKAELNRLTQQRQRQIQKRKESGMPTISIVGYTNAGKTTLFQRLTKKGIQGQNILFATLDSTVGKVYLPSHKAEAFVTDTIGFIKNLPPSLIDAFKSTLLESVHADILVHVIDGSSPTVFDQFHTVETILSELDLKDKDEIIVVNKSDIATKERTEEINTRLHIAHPVFISANTGEGIERLIQTVELRLEEQTHPAPANKTVKIISHDLDENYERPPEEFSRGRRRAPRAVWSSDEKKEIVKPALRIPTRDELKIGQSVRIVEKSNQKTGEESQGTIKRLLSHGFTHPHGIKVELTNGKIGRVKKIILH